MRLWRNSIGKILVGLAAGGLIVKAAINMNKMREASRGLYFQFKLFGLEASEVRGRIASLDKQLTRSEFFALVKNPAAVQGLAIHTKEVNKEIIILAKKLAEVVGGGGIPFESFIPSITAAMQGDEQALRALAETFGVNFSDHLRKDGKFGPTLLPAIVEAADASFAEAGRTWAKKLLLETQWGIEQNETAFGWMAEMSAWFSWLGVMSGNRMMTAVLETVRTYKWLAGSDDKAPASVVAFMDMIETTINDRTSKLKTAGLVLDLVFNWDAEKWATFKATYIDSAMETMRQRWINVFGFDPKPFTELFNVWRVQGFSGLLKRIQTDWKLAWFWLRQDWDLGKLWSKFKTWVQNEWDIDIWGVTWTTLFDWIEDKFDELMAKLKTASKLFTAATGMSIPGIPGFQHGGIVPGRPSQVVPTLLHGGERVISKGNKGTNNGNGGSTVIKVPLMLDSRQIGEVVIDALNRTARYQSGLNRFSIGETP